MNIPLTEAEVRSLHIGDTVSLTGTIYTSRDAAHKYLAGTPDLSRLPDFRGTALYHCGPVIVKENGLWRVTAAGPTTSSREEPYEACVIEHFGIRAIIGKGGMGEKTLAACQRFGCVYLHAVGGTAQLLANAVKRVPKVYFYEEFGAPEAIWQFEVVDFPAIVTMDTHGRSLHADVLAESTKNLDALLK